MSAPFEKVLLARIHKPDSATLASYVGDGGYQGLAKAVNIVGYDKRKDDPVTAEDIAKQDYMRRNWWEDRWYSDPYTRNVVPMDVWALSTLPPEVKF